MTASVQTASQMLACRVCSNRAMRDHSTSGPNGKLLWMAMSANKPVSSASGNPFISISLTPKAGQVD